MEWKVFTTVFFGVLIAEMADKTQLVTVLFAAQGAASKWIVFAGAAGALLLTSAIAVLVGGLFAEVLEERYVSIVAGLGFLGIGGWMLYQGLR